VLTESFWKGILVLTERKENGPLTLRKNKKSLELFTFFFLLSIALTAAPK
jgi:hypothetical protein